MATLGKVHQITYQNFDLLITVSGDEYHARVLASPVGEGATATFADPLTAAELHHFYTGEPLAVVDPPPQRPTPQTVGTQLYNALFGGSVGECLRSSLHSINANKGLRINLRIEANAASLADLPWEFLYAPNEGRFLVLSERTVLVRYVELLRAQAPLPVAPPLHILAVTPEPDDVKPLQIEEEWQRLQTALQPLVAQGLVILDRLERATLSALQDRLRKANTHILHFIGHGYFDEDTEEGGLILEDESHQRQWVSANRFATLLHDHSALRLVFLNACEGARGSHNDFFAGTAQTLVHRGIPAVVAMQFDVSDEAGQILAREFYEALADSYPVDAALAEARKALYAASNDLEWATPVLFSRAPDNQILDLSQAPSIPQSPAYWLMPFQRNPDFVGRSTDLDQLHELLQAPQNGERAPVGIRSAGLTGQGGIGKTQLAVEYAYRQQMAYPDGIFFLNAAASTDEAFDRQMVEEFAKLARHIEQADLETSEIKQAKAAATYLRRHPASLLVLDNVAETVFLQRMIAGDFVLARLPCTILFTTRQSYLGEYRALPVSVLPEKIALQLLLTQCDRTDILQLHHGEHSAARQICAQVGYLPLALQICAAFLVEWPEIPLADFAQRLIDDGCIGTLDEELAELPDLPPERLSTIHRAGLEAILHTQWKKLPNEAARQLLQVAGQLPEAAQIPVARLGLLAGIDQKSYPGRPSLLDRAMKRLSRSSLVEELNEEQIRLHPLVREFAANQTLANNIASFRSQCVENLHRAYCDIVTLEDHVNDRGVHAVERDIITALNFMTDQRSLSLPQRNLSLSKAKQSPISDLRSPISINPIATPILHTSQLEPNRLSDRPGSATALPGTEHADAYMDRALA